MKRAILSITITLKLFIYMADLISKDIFPFAMLFGIQCSFPIKSTLNKGKMQFLYGMVFLHK